VLAHDPTGAANRLSHGWARTTRTQVFPGRLPEPPATLAGALLFTAIIAMRSQAALDAPLVVAEVPVVVYLPARRCSESHPWTSTTPRC
jgi:hypothetical protein